MRYADSFGTYHPLVQLIYFLSVIGITMFCMDPVFLAISLTGSLLYLLAAEGGAALWQCLKLILPTAVLFIVVNPLVSHNGVTVLTELPDGNMLTLESVIFGVAAAVLMACTVQWFYAVHRIMTADRIIYLFGRLSPRLALLIAMTLNFISKLSRRAQAINVAEKGLYGVGEKKRLHRLRHSIHSFSCLITWALESSVETADAMNSRGYGLKKRSFYSSFQFRPSDVFCLITALLLTTAVISGVYFGAVEWSYYPFFTVRAADALSVSVYSAFFLLCIMPLIIEVKEAVRWNSLRSTI